jgi:hypothetical protein
MLADILKLYLYFAKYQSLTENFSSTMISVEISEFFQAIFK